jgi:hypothetical protein
MRRGSRSPHQCECVPTPGRPTRSRGTRATETPPNVPVRFVLAPLSERCELPRGATRVVSAPRADQDVAVVVDRETVWSLASEMTERHERRTLKTRGGHRAFTVGQLGKFIGVRLRTWGLKANTGRDLVRQKGRETGPLSRQPLSQRDASAAAPWGRTFA